MSMYSIILSNLVKSYTLRHEKPTLVEDLFMRRKKEVFKAVDGISLQIKKGEKIGIIGRNGSGKTTLLKLISGITHPNSGRVLTQGRVVSLIDLESGFHPELTGIENIFLNGLLVGMTKDEVSQRIDSIIRFADIGSFIDTPLFTYSQGMKLRLGFSVAVHAEPDILILDEGIAVGDQEFQKKAGKKIEDFFKKKKTVLVVTHWLEYLEQHCSRIIWVEDGKIKNDGGVEILKLYSQSE